jgi:hypothetical protein
METKVFRNDLGVAREWNERRWAMVKTTRVAWVGTLAGLVLGLCLFGTLSPAQARTTSDQPAAILYWPKIVVDTAGQYTGGVPTDTLIRLSNTCAPGISGNPCANLPTTGLNGMKQAHCFYIDANSHCSNNPTQICQTGAECGVGSCDPGWSEIDFEIVLTKEQPLAWHASEGLGRWDLPMDIPGLCGLPPIHICTSDSQCNGGCIRQQSNIGTGVPPVPEDPFVGSLQCIEYDPLANPPAPDQTTTTNTLKGEATIESLPPDAVDLASYNAVGVKYLGGAGSFSELVLDGVEYDSCPTTLVLDHAFDVSEPGFELTTDLTLAPCGNDFLSQTCGVATAQFIVFNEFEQRFSTTRLVDCFLESPISNLDTTDPTRSIFSVNVQGTLVGQTRIHPVGNAPTGRGLVGVARLLTEEGSTAYNLHQAGSPAAPAARPDIITIP